MAYTGLIVSPSGDVFRRNHLYRIVDREVEFCEGQWIEGDFDETSSTCRNITVIRATYKTYAFSSSFFEVSFS